MKHKLNHFTGSPRLKRYNEFDLLEEYKHIIEKEKALLGNYNALSCTERAYLLNVYKNHVATYYYLLRGGHK